MEKDIGVSRRTDANPVACWVLHESVEERGEQKEGE